MIKIKNAVAAYEGKTGECMCGCAGKNFKIEEAPAKVLAISNALEMAMAEMPAEKIAEMKAAFTLVEREDYLLLDNGKKLMVVYYGI